MKLSRHWVIASVLGLCVFCESMAYTYVQQNGDLFFYSSSILYVLAGVAICILPLLNATEPVEISSATSRLNRFLPYLFYAFLIGLLIYHVALLSPLYKSWKVDARWADMIPLIQLSCKRLLHGLPVYVPTPELGTGLVNAYFPMMWIPYLPSEILGYDPRWTTLCALFISLLVAGLPILKSGKKTEFIPMCIAGVSLFLVLNYFLYKYNGFWAMTEEGVVAGYYILLGFALLSENYYLTGFAMACCLLSRYALIPWLPVYFGYLYFTQTRRNFLKTLLTFSAVVMGVFVIPYFIWNPLYFLGLPGVQAGTVQSFWGTFHLTKNGYYNVGLYKFFTIQQTGLMVVIELVTAFLLPLVFIIAVKKLQTRNKLNTRYVAFGSLKLALLCFYNFIPAPYMYLFFPATLMSYAVLFDYISTRQLPEGAVS